MKKICCIGHITLDRIVNPVATIYQNGGTAYYFAHGMARFPDAHFQLVTSLAEEQMASVEEIRKKGVEVVVFPSRKTVYFENIYGEDQNHRTQRVLCKADPFRVEQFADMDADIFHLGSLLADDFSLELVRYLSTKGVVSLDAQGFLRRVNGLDVEACDWDEKREVLKYVDIMKVNEHEMAALTGETDPLKAGRTLASWGAKEVVITEGSLGSFIYVDQQMHQIPAYPPLQIVDATGCGDTYMTGYLYQRAQGATPREAGCFAAAMSTLKLEHFGPFSDTVADIHRLVEGKR